MPKKRGNNDGSIRQRPNGTWEARYVAGYLPDGKPDRKSVYAATQEEVQKKLREVLRQIDRGEYVEPSKVTLGQWLDRWYAVYGEPRWRLKTAAVHYDNIRLHIKPALGKITLQKLRRDHVQSFVNKQVDAGFAPSTIRKQLEPLKAALKQALDDRHITIDPSSRIKLPQIIQPEINPLTLEEQRLLLTHLPDTNAGRALAFALRTGLRASELCGLQWGDIEEGSFHVQRSAQYVHIPKDKQIDGVKCILVIESTKTTSSNRHIPLTDTIRGILETQKVDQIRKRLAIGTLWAGGTPGQGDCYVFATRTGTVVDRSNLSRTLRTSLEKVGVSSRGIHALRHTFATNGIIHVKDASVHTVSKLLGHTKVAFTMQKYVHSDMEAKQASMEAIDSLI